jgi:hypothetical protein
MVYLVTPIRASRPSTTEKAPSIDPIIESIIANNENDQSTVLIEPKTAALVSNDRRQSI